MLRSVNCDSVVQIDVNIQNNHRFFGSVRMIYVICAFIAMALHLFMRSTLNLTVLCMTDDDDLSWTRQQAISLLGYFYLGYLITLPIAGRLADSFGGKHFFVQSILLQAIVFLLIPIFATSSYWSVVILSVLQGLISGFGSPSIYQLFTNWAHPKECTALLSFAFSGFSVGSLLIFPISGFLCQFGWQWAFFGIGVPSLFTGIAFNWLVYSTIDDHPRISQEEYKYLKAGRQNNIKCHIPWKLILTSGPIYAFIATHVFHTYGILLLTLMLPRFLHEAMAFSLTEVSIYSSTYFVGTLLSKIIIMFTFNNIERKLHSNMEKVRRILYVSCNTITIILIVGILFLTYEYRIIIVLLTFLIGVSTDFSFSAAYWPSLLFLAPSYAGLLSGLANSLATISGFLIPLISAKIINNGTKDEWNVLLSSMILSYCVSGVIYGFFGSSKLLSWGRVQNHESTCKNEKITITESAI